mmetsp:Transcript_23353/g.61331  ORF Transcript_23353/g.61331 Transcript_23353/m.61331 type:complete len:132 (-) Transcript_23353:437-832(-)
MAKPAHRTATRPSDGPMHGDVQQVNIVSDTKVDGSFVTPLLDITFDMVRGGRPGAWASRAALVDQRPGSTPTGSGLQLLKGVRVPGGALEQEVELLCAPVSHLRHLDRKCMIVFQLSTALVFVADHAELRL